MLDRRSVLKLGAVGIAGTLVNVPGQANAAAGMPPRYSLGRAVYDECFEDALAFARVLDNRGVLTTGIRGDVANLWYQDLRIRLRQGLAPVAGLTDRAALFCLEELMRDVGMKTRFRVDHMIGRNGRVEHEAVGPATLVQATRGLPPSLGFGASMAVLASNDWTDEPGNIAAQKRFGPYCQANRTALVSWIIA